MGRHPAKSAIPVEEMRRLIASGKSLREVGAHAGGLSKYQVKRLLASGAENSSSDAPNAPPSPVTSGSARYDAAMRAASAVSGGNLPGGGSASSPAAMTPHEAAEMIRSLAEALNSTVVTIAASAAKVPYDHPEIDRLKTLTTGEKATYTALAPVAAPHLTETLNSLGKNSLLVLGAVFLVFQVPRVLTLTRVLKKLRASAGPQTEDVIVD